MRVTIFIIRKLLVVSLLLTIVSSCSKNETVPDNSYFISKELAVSYTKDYIINQLNTAGGSIPELSRLTSLIKSNVDVYSIVYKTTINGKKTDASGLVCVPSDPGDYPVLSFQNGTNTVNAYAPSQFPIDFSYQMVEIIASMGYVVVIADYPGFGASVQIPHPYLVKEPTVQSLVDILYAAKEFINNEFHDISLNNDFYLLGYSQGGWATLALHKSLEIDHSSDFNLRGSVCGAGPYDISLLFGGMVSATTYPVPAYIGYIINAYKAYDQFTNPASGILNEPYASRIGNLYTGVLSIDQINAQLTTSIPDLITPGFLSGFNDSPDYAPVREAMVRNSISAWKTNKSLLLIHGGSDTQVNPVSTENMYSAMIQAGTSADLCSKVILSGLDHSDGAVPCMIRGILFLTDIKNQK